MGLTIILIYVLPPIVLIALGLLSIRLTFSGFFPGRTNIGWALLGVALAVFCLALALGAGTGEVGFGTTSVLFYIIFLAFLFGLQVFLIVELVTLAMIPDPSKGLKLLKVHTEAEKKVNQDDLPGAIEEFEKIIAKDPKDFEARFRLAEICCENGEYRKAATTYENLLKYAGKLGSTRHCSALTRLSEIYSRNLGDMESARKYTRAIIDTYPDTRHADYARDRLENL